MINKKRFSTILIFLSLPVVLAIFTLAGSAQSNEKYYLPAVLSVSGKPPVTPTPTTRHFNKCVSNTGENATIGVKTGVVINGSLVLEEDDEIAIFAPDGSICAGMKPWDGKNTAITAWGDDSQTAEIDGLRGGEAMVFRIWDNSANKELAVKNVSYSYGNGIYMPDGIYVVKSLTPE